MSSTTENGVMRNTICKSCTPYTDVLLCTRTFYNVSEAAIEVSRTDKGIELD